MNWVLSFVAEVCDMDVDDITHHVVEHEEACGFLDWLFMVVSIHQEEYWSQDLVHSLDVDCLGIELGKDKENTSHVVIDVAPLLLLRGEVLQGFVP